MRCYSAVCIYIYINGNCSLPCSVFYPNFYIRQYVVVDMKIMGFFNMMWLRKQYLKMLVYVCLSTELSSGYNLNTALLAYWGRVTHICVSNLTIIGRRQAIIGTNADFLLIRTSETNFTEVHIFPFKKMHLKMPSAKWRQLWLGLNVLTRFRMTPCLGIPASVRFALGDISVLLLELHSVCCCSGSGAAELELLPCPFT